MYKVELSREAQRSTNDPTRLSPRKGRKRLLWIVFGGVLAVGCVYLLFQVAMFRPLAGRGPSVLVMHMDGEWVQVRIHSASSNHKSPLVFEAPAKQIRVEQMGYGPYDIEIRYKDEKSLWLQCYHTDAGMAKTIQVNVKRETGGNKAAVMTTCTYQDRPPTVDFSKDVVIDETGEKSPCRIWGGP